LTAFDFIMAGATAIGVGGELLPKEALHFRQEDRIRELAGRFIGMVKMLEPWRIHTISASRVCSIVRLSAEGFLAESHFALQIGDTCRTLFCRRTP